MRIEYFDPQKFDTGFAGIVKTRMENAARIIEMEAKNLCPVGTISRPMYRTGKYAGQKWTSRDMGRLKGSIRITKLRKQTGYGFNQPLNIRVYAGHYMAWYAAIVEHDRHFMRRAKNRSKMKVKAALGAK